MKTSLRHGPTTGVAAALIALGLSAVVGAAVAQPSEMSPKGTYGPPGATSDTVAGAPTPPPSTGSIGAEGVPPGEPPPFFMPPPAPHTWPGSGARPATGWPSGGPPPPSTRTLMPNLHLMTREAALATLGLRHLTAGQIASEPGDAAYAGLVVDQSPKAGTLVDQATPISVYLAVATPAPPTTPAASGQGHGGQPATHVPTPRPASNPAPNPAPVVAGSKTPDGSPLSRGRATQSPATPGPSPAGQTAGVSAHPDNGKGSRAPLLWALLAVAALAALTFAISKALAAMIAVRPGWDPAVETEASVSATPAGPNVDIEAWLEPGEAAPDGPLPIRDQPDTDGIKRDV